MSKDVSVVEELSAEELQVVRSCESIDGDEEFLVMILGMLADSLTKKLASIRENLEKEDFEAVWKDAHSLKGSALQCSLDALSDAAKSVETHFKQVAAGEETFGPDSNELVETLSKEGKRVQNTSAKLQQS